MKRTPIGLVVVLSLAAMAQQLSAQATDKPGDRLTCPANAVHDPGNLPKFANISVNDGVAFLNDRVPPTGTVFYAPPEHKIFVLTDLVV